jgi:cellobiose phosphorylase
MSNTTGAANTAMSLSRKPHLSKGDEAASHFSYYDDAAREYVVTDPRKPTKWVNYIGTLDFGGFDDETGGLDLCKKDPANSRLTSYPIDTPADGRYAVFSPFFTPMLTPYAKFECRMGLGYNKWVVRMNSLEFDIAIFVPAGRLAGARRSSRAEPFGQDSIRNNAESLAPPKLPMQGPQGTNGQSRDDIGPRTATRLQLPT